MKTERTTVTLTREECMALHEIIGQLSGNSPENVFSWSEPNNPEDPTMSACAKVYHLAGQTIPKDLMIHVEG